MLALGGGAGPGGPGPARGLAGHQRRRGAAGACPARVRVLPAPLLPSGRALADLPREGAAEAAAGGSLDGEAGFVRGLRQRGHPGRLPDAPEGPHRGAQVAAGLAGERAAEVPAQEKDGGGSDVRERLPQAQQEDPLLVPALQSHRQAPLGGTGGLACGACYCGVTVSINTTLLQLVSQCLLQPSPCISGPVPRSCCCTRPELFAGSAPDNHLWHASCSSSQHLLTFT